ncbi:PH-like domain containing protein [Babesia gibsoni]|uniref:PH-like domain containing protein n=1 Tax=Babesia gibsoni TaxID=33632 RepID=A0AAD8UQV0_BABGI|nr:PH-like domain containing protein [Babesia gibsoni]
MGNQQSGSCCDGLIDSEVLTSREEPLTPEEETKFMSNMVNGCDTEIVFADGTSMPCSLMYDLAEDCLHMVVEDKRRIVALNDIYEILEADSVSGLSNMEKAMIINPCIVAFRLKSTRKAILLRFRDAKESQGFYHFLKDVIQDNEDKEGSDSAANMTEDDTQVPSQTVII